MDMKRFKEISWQEALAKWLDGEHVFSSTGRTYCMKGFKLHYFLGGDDNGSPSSIMFNDVIEEHWYVKKPFDVRAEMLDRPNEWVGAFKRSDDEWMAIGFDSNHFEVATIPLKNMNVAKPTDSAMCQLFESSHYLDRCIPIEDVPEEELT
ncbi:hypothetical protein [uncultured Exiguobacterium sp.]|uniref:hypothetical protein n=1 Tax=uncultured Exiguobacterium sp. TaxID=202669 RepID=UPI0025FF4C61|nr:hypothetical protein [uncultured Exiguobacterium sp.]